MEEDLAMKICAIKNLYHSIETILGSVEADQSEIDEIDQLRVSVLNMIEKVMPLL